MHIWNKYINAFQITDCNMSPCKINFFIIHVLMEQQIRLLFSRDSNPCLQIYDQLIGQFMFSLIVLI
jgi:hypothetical protein